MQLSIFFRSVACFTFQLNKNNLLIKSSARYLRPNLATALIQGITQTAIITGNLQKRLDLN